MQSKTENRPPLQFFPSNLIIRSSKWYSLESLVPWQETEELLSPLFSERGRNAIPVRHIIGALIIQTRKNLSDRETLGTIMETPMLQYFLGLDDHVMEELFDHALLCKCRQKIGLDIAKDMIDALLRKHNVGEPVVSDETATHAGSLSTDATVVPVNITYPTDLKLLNQVREKTEEIIDDCHKASTGQEKPRTYRKDARENYLTYAKAKRLSSGKRRSALRRQLQYVKRNIKNIETCLENGAYDLGEAMEESFSTCKQIYEQQQTMWDEKTNRIDDRIAGLHQPHVRCIVRGKAGSPYEFGPKIAVGKVNGYIRIDELSFDNFNESVTLKPIVTEYHKQYGVYPEVVRGDRIYQTRENKVFCSSLGIRLSGKPLGRPKLEDRGVNQAPMVEDFKRRLEIEGVFGVAKTKYGLAKLMTKLPESQKASIGLVFFVMNLLQVLSFTLFFETLEMLVFEVEVNHEVFVYEDERPDLTNVL